MSLSYDAAVSAGAASDPAAFRWLPTGADGLEAMLAGIGNARESVALESYIFAADSQGGRFLAALVAARRRGVRVRVLIDAVGSMGLPSGFWSPLLLAGGEFRWFNGFEASRSYGHRNHRKLLVVDGRLAVIGGFNIAQEYDGNGVSRGWRDLGMEVRGPVALALADAFDEQFAQADRRPSRFLRLYPTHESVIRGERWTLLLSGWWYGHRAMKRSLVHDLARARRVRIICAYFLPTWRLRRALMKVARRGGQVQLILAGKTDVPLSRLASASLYAKFLRAGVEIYEYEPQILHAKLFLLDEAVYVGSANLDVRSLNINDELLLRVADGRAAAEAGRIFESDLAHCRRIDPVEWRTSRTLWRRLLERGAYLLLARLDPYLNRVAWGRRARTALEKLEEA